MTIHELRNNYFFYSPLKEESKLARLQQQVTMSSNRDNSSKRNRVFKILNHFILAIDIWQISQ